MAPTIKRFFPMKLFVTGGTGFIGTHFLQMATASGHTLLALRRPGGRPRLPLETEPIWLDGDIRDDWRNELAQCDALVHLAAHGVTSAHESWETCFKVNVQDALQLFLNAADCGIRRFVVCGSCFEYGRAGERRRFICVDSILEPTGPYHASKAAATMMSVGLGIDRALEMLILRPFHVYGEGEAESRFWPSLCRAARKGQDFPMTVGTQVRDFTPVSVVAKALLQGVERDDLEAGFPRIENVGSGGEKSLLEFANEEWARLGATGRLLPGVVPFRTNEVMRYVPKL